MQVLSRILPNRGLSSEDKAAKKAEKLAAMDVKSISINLRYLHESMRGNDESLIEKDTLKLKKRIDNAADVNVSTDDVSSYWNPFNMAVSTNVPAFALEWLMQAGGNPNTVIEDESLLTRTASCVGISNSDRVEKATVLLKYGARVGQQELRAAVENDNVALFKLFEFALKELGETGVLEEAKQQAEKLVAVAPNPTMAYYVMKAFDLSEAVFIVKEDGKAIDQITISYDAVL